MDKPTTNAEPNRRQIAKRERGWLCFSGLLIAGIVLVYAIVSAVFRGVYMSDLEINDPLLNWKVIFAIIGAAGAISIFDLIYSWECWLDRAKRHLEIECRVGRWRWRRIKTFDALSAVVVRKSWIRDGTIHVDKGFSNRRETTWLVLLGESRGLEVGSFQFEGQAEELARELAEWSGLELRLERKD